MVEHDRDKTLWQHGAWAANLQRTGIINIDNNNSSNNGKWRLFLQIQG
jgi:hypothetical protein